MIWKSKYAEWTEQVRKSFRRTSDSVAWKSSLTPEGASNQK